MKSVLDNYLKLIELFQELESSTESDAATKMAGIISKMETHSFLFGKCNKNVPSSTFVKILKLYVTCRTLEFFLLQCCHYFLCI